MSKQTLRFRSILFWPHLVVGLAAGLVVFALSLTGSLLAFERPILAYSDSVALGRVEPSPTRLALSELMPRVQTAAGQPVSSITVPADNHLPLMLEAGRDRIFLVDPYRGTVVGPASPGLRTFFRQVTALHRWFGFSDAAHKTVLLIKGWFTLAFVFLILSGWYLWLPATWTPAALRVRMRPRWAATARAREFNWHHSFGLWFSLPLLVIALTGVVMALPWANQLLFSVTGSPLPQAREGKQPEGRAEQTKGAKQHSAHAGHSNAAPAPDYDRPDYDRMVQTASNQQSGWRNLQIRVPGGEVRSAQIIVDRGNGAQPQRRDTLVFDPSGNLVRTDLFAQQSLGRKSRLVGRFLHTGEIFGFVGEFVALLACLAGMLLVYTGISLSIRRFTRKAAPIKREIPVS